MFSAGVFLGANSLFDPINRAVDQESLEGGVLARI